MTHVKTLLFQELAFMECLLWAKSPLAIPVFQVLQTGRLGQEGAEWELLPEAGALVLHEDHTASLPGVSSWRHQMLWQDPERCHL